jgi:hypothetical protein
MAYIRDFAVTEVNANSASVVCEMPVHATDDIIMYFANKDGTAVVNDPGGSWTSLQDGVSAGAAYRVGWLLATGSSHTLTLTTGTTDTWTIIVVSIDGANTSAPISASAESAGDATAMPFAGPSTNTGTDTNCLIFHFWSSDTGISPTAYAPLTNLYSGDNGTNSGALAYTFQPAAGAVAASSWYGRANDDGRGVVVAVKDDGAGTQIPPYSDPAISSGQVIRPLVGLATTYSDTWPTSLSIVALGSDFEANSVYLYESAPTWTDKTSVANSPATADLTWPIHNTGDAMYFGSSSKFKTLGFITSTAGTVGVVAWEYWNGAWTTAPGMSGAFTATGGARVAFTNEAAPADWVTNDPGMGYTKYWVRCRITTAYTVAIIQSQVRLDGFVAAYIVATAAADGGTNPYTDATQNAGSSSTANLAGPQITLGASVNLSSGILMGTIRPVLPRDFAVDIALPTKIAGGIQVTLLDTNNNLLSYKIGAKGCQGLDLAGRNIYAFDWNGSAVSWASAGTIDKTAVTKLFLSTYGYFGAVAIQWSMLSLVTRIAVAGGSSTYPLGFEDLAFIANYSIGWFPFFKVDGNAATVWIPVQIGGGDPIRIECDLNYFQFPRQYDGTDYFAWNVGTNVAGFKFYPKTGDVIKFTKCVFTSDSPYRWEFDASSATSGWTGDFSGSSIIGATVTLQDCFTFNDMAFINCPSFTQNGAPITNSAFTGTKVTSASPADAAQISDCSFVSAGTGHAIEIGGTAANFDLSGVSFSGYSGTSTNAAIFVNIATGNMTISIKDGGTTPSVRTAGATVTVVNAVTVKVTAKNAADSSVIEGARVYLVADSGGDLTPGVVILNALTNSSGVVEDTAFSYTNPQPVIGRVRKGTGTPLYKTAPLSGTITSPTGLDITAFLVGDE